VELIRVNVGRTVVGRDERCIRTYSEGRACTYRRRTECNGSAPLLGCLRGGVFSDLAKRGAFQQGSTARVSTVSKGANVLYTKFFIKIRLNRLDILQTKRAPAFSSQNGNWPRHRRPPLRGGGACAHAHEDELRTQRRTKRRQAGVCIGKVARWPSSEQQARVQDVLVEAVQRS